MKILQKIYNFVSWTLLSVIAGALGLTMLELIVEADKEESE